MAKQTKEPKQPKEKFITLRTAARKYDTNERNILNWAKDKKITAGHIGDTWVIDENSLFRYFEKNKIISNYDEHLEEIIKERENLISQKENELFLLGSLRTLTPAGGLLISAMSLLINDRKKQDIFIQISSGHDINLVALQHKITVEKVRYHYNFAVKIISQKSDILKEYRDNLAQLKFKIRELEINNQIKENEINRLVSACPSIPRKAPEKITAEIVKLLSTSLFNLNFETRALSCFRWFNINTVGELLQFTKGYGFKILLGHRSFGKMSLSQLKAVLIENNIIDLNEDSYLYKFL